MLLARLLRWQGELAEAEELVLVPVNFCSSSIVNQWPDSRQIRMVQTAALTELADVLAATDRLEEAESRLRSAAHVTQKLLGGLSPNTLMVQSITGQSEWVGNAEPETLREHIEIQIRLGVVLGRLGRFYEARQTLADAVRAAYVLRSTYARPAFCATEANARFCLASLLRDASHSEADDVAVSAARVWHSLLQSWPSGNTLASGTFQGADLQAFLTAFPEQRDAVSDSPPPKSRQFNEGLATLEICQGMLWYRHGSYGEAISSLDDLVDEESGADSYAWFYLAMANHQAGKRDQALMQYHQAVDWMKKNKPNNQELAQLRNEAAGVLEIEKPTAAQVRNATP